MGSLSKILGPFNLRIFEFLVNEGFSVRDLAKKANCSPAKITQFANLYSGNGLVVVHSTKNRRVIELDKSSPLVREIIALIFINKILESGAFAVLKTLSVSIGVYGSVVEGTVDRQSDVDLWAISDKKPGIVEIGRLKRQFADELGRETSIRFFAKADVESLREKDPIFYNELECKSRILQGEGF